MAYKHLTENPITLNLKEIGTQGAEFTYTREGGELNSVLNPAIGQNPYHITLRIQPSGNVYLAAGQIETVMNLTCSLCADDLKYPIQGSFNEVLIVSEKTERTAHTAKVNHSSELHFDGPNCTELKTEEFQIAEFLYELIAILEPIKPTRSPDCDSTCPSYQEALRKGWLNAGNQGDFKKENAFSALKGIKLNG